MYAAMPPSEQPTGPTGTDLHQPPAKTSEPVQSTDLFKGRKSVAIEHNGSSYRLQTTKLGKLILTK